MLRYRSSHETDVLKALQRLAPTAVAVTFIALPALLLRPFQNTPFVDDWVYAWSVERLLQNGTLELLEISTNPNPVQILWGALFCAPFGFSFSALKLSTVFLSSVCLVGLFKLLREVGANQQDALLGTACLAFYPPYFVLSFTFMTDVPFTALWTWSLFSLLRSVKEQRDSWLLASVAFASLATGVRIIGVAMVPVSLMTLFISRQKWGRRWYRLTAPLLPGIILLALYGWTQTNSFRSADISLLPTAPARRLTYLPEALGHFYLYVLVTAIFVLSHTALLAFPWFIANSQDNRWRLATFIAFPFLAGCIWLYSNNLLPVPCPLCDDNIWALSELGMSRRLFTGYEWNSPTFIETILKWCPLLFTTFGIARVRCQKHGLPTYCLASAIVFLGLASAALFLWMDRYLLPFAPVILALLFMCAGIRLRMLAATAVAVMAGVSLLGTADYIKVDAALWRGVARLREMGVPVRHIDGGYVVNGWLQFAHPENAPHDSSGELVVPFVTTKHRLQYMLSSRPYSGYRVVGQISFSQFLSRDGSVFLLETVRPPDAQ